MVEITNNCGTCKGITKALALVYDVYEKELLKDNPKNIYVYQELISNDKVINELKEIGIEVIDDIKIATEDDIVIIGAFGQKRAIKEYLENNNIEFYDATCSKLLKVGQTIEEKYSEGFEIVIIGNAFKSEVDTINDYCNNSAVIIKDDTDFIKLGDNKKKYVLCSSFVSKNDYEEIKMKLKTLYDNYDIEFGNYYCNCITKMFDDAKSTAKKSDMAFIICNDDLNSDALLNENQKYVDSYKFSNLNDMKDFVLKSDINFNNNISLIGDNSTPVKEIYKYKYLLEFHLFYKSKIRELSLMKNEERNITSHNNDILKNISYYFNDLNANDDYNSAILIALGQFIASDHETDDYINMALAYKMFETSISIHWDIFDNQKMHNDSETIPRRICHKYLNLKNDKDYQNDVLKLANSVGVCSGNLGLVEASNYIMNNYSNNENINNMLALFNIITQKTIEGKILDIYLPFYGKYEGYEIKESEFFDLSNLKFSWPKLIGPFLLGFTLGGQKEYADIENVLSKMGLYCNIKNDLSNIYESEDCKLDIETFKQTLLYSHVITTPYKKEFLKIYGNKDIESSDTKKLKSILDESGSLNYVSEFVNNLEFEIMEAVDDLNISETGKNLLKGLLIYIDCRNNKNE